MLRCEPIALRCTRSHLLKTCETTRSAFVSNSPRSAGSLDLYAAGDRPLHPLRLRQVASIVKRSLSLVVAVDFEVVNGCLSRHHQLWPDNLHICHHSKCKSDQAGNSIAIGNKLSEKENISRGTSKLQQHIYPQVTSLGTSNKFYISVAFEYMP